jgi:hypothetical protein
MEGRNYTITIELPSEAENNSPIAGDTKQSPKEEASALPSKDQVRSLAKKIVSYHTAKSFANQVWNYKVSLVALKTGSNELQQKEQFIKNQIQGAAGVIESTIYAGMTGGPGAAALVIGASIAQQVVSVAQNQYTLNVERSLEDLTLNMGHRRAGTKGYRNNE